MGDRRSASVVEKMQPGNTAPQRSEDLDDLMRFVGTDPDWTEGHTDKAKDPEWDWSRTDDGWLTGEFYVFQPAERLGCPLVAGFLSVQQARYPALGVDSDQWRDSRRRIWKIW